MEQYLLKYRGELTFAS